MRILECLPALVPALVLGLAAPAWAGPDAATARLIDAGMEDGVLTLGLDIRMEPGWKTYWRNPGMSGVPPRFDWSGSDNVAGIRVEYPAPKRFRDGQEWVVGYDGRVVLPVRVTPAEPSRPVRVKLSLDYAICRDMCVPLSAELALERAPDAAASRFQRAEVEAYAARVPEADSVDAPRIRVVARKGDSLTVAVDLPDADLFADGAGQWAPPLPAAAAKDGGVRQLFTLDLRKAPAAGTLELVAVSPGRAVERAIFLDALAPTP